MNQIIIKSVFLFAIILVQFFQEGFAQATFQKTYGGGAMDIGRSVRQLSDQGFIFTGTTNSFLDSEGGVYLIRTDASGDTLWTRTYGGINNWEDGACVRQTHDGGFILAGGAYSFGNGGEDAYVVKVDGAGSLQWSVTIGDSLDNRANWIEQTRDGNYIICGTTSGNGAGLSDVYLILLDSTGSLIRTKTYGGPGNDYGYIVKQTIDGGFIIQGSTTISGQSKCLLIRTDSSGTPVWSMSIDESHANNLIETNDGCYALTGVCNSYSVNRTFLYKISNEHHFLWGMTYDYDGSTGNSVVQTEDGGYFILREKEGQSGLIRTDSLGVIEWYKQYFTEGEQNQGFDMCLTMDHGCVITGTEYMGASDFDIFLYKTDSIGNSGCTDIEQNIPTYDFTPPINSISLSVSQDGSTFSPSTNVNKVNTMVHTIGLPVAGFAYYSDSTTKTVFYKLSFNEMSWHWDFGDGSEDSVNTTVYHTFPDSGTYNVCIRVKNNCGSDEYCHIVTITAPGGVEEMNPVITKIYPNPATDFVVIEFENIPRKEYSLFIYNSIGQMVMRRDQIRDNYIKIDRNNIPQNGIYFFRISDSTGISGNGKFIFK
jgi:hypothetical protein